MSTETSEYESPVDMRGLLSCTAILFVLAAGCSVLANTAALSESERTVILEVPYAEAYDRLLGVLRSEEYPIEEASREEGTIRTGYRRDARLDALSGSAWSQVEVLLEEMEAGTEIVFLVSGRYSAASPAAGREEGQIPQSDQRAVVEDLKRALQESSY